MKKSPSNKQWGPYSGVLTMLRERHESTKYDIEVNT